MSKEEFQKQNNLIKFDEGKEYGTYIVVHDKDNIDFAKEVLCANMKLFVPERFWNFITYPVAYNKPFTVKVKKDNYKILGAKKEEIGKTLEMKLESWSVGWFYRRVG